MHRPQASLALAAMMMCSLFASHAHAGGYKATFSPEGVLDKDEIREVVRANIDQIRRCYNQELQRDPDSSGRLVADFVIGKAGKVIEVSISESQFPVELDSCIAGAIESWTFPAPEGGGKVKVAYPFVLTPG